MVTCQRLRDSSKRAEVTSALKRQCGSRPAVIAHSAEYASSSDCHAKRRLQSVFCANEKL